MKFILIFSLFYLFQINCFVKFINLFSVWSVNDNFTSFYQDEKREKRRHFRSLFSLNSCVIFIYYLLCSSYQRLCCPFGSKVDLKNWIERCVRNKQQVQKEEQRII